ncbi:hypothetical protein DSCO28_02030 [Desulfosarcina ovata subsp. sediminis]|uniref:TPM domain-containing protein n=1 Tax=Desulfosarcina ovata subsp. sediminis TaxID=885957 RepID=A0A5K7ZI61_9BACT|nr:hypothetical protein [Desulfosarcina ovata]BBO79637.1 hypothetical protein DSCO28_02030 [Desulfosarcina ovata subsp. sediminis]
MKYSFKKHYALIAIVFFFITTFQLETNIMAQIPNDIRSEYLQLKADVNKYSPRSEKMLKAFDKHASELLSKWENEAPKDILIEIALLKRDSLKSRLEAIDRLEKHGVEGRGAALILTKLVGSTEGLQGGGFWGGTIDEGKKASNALINMGEAGAIALVYAYIHNFDGISLKMYVDSYGNSSGKSGRMISYGNRLATAHEGLEKIFSLSVKKVLPREYWISLWATSNPDKFIKHNKSSDQDKSSDLTEYSWYKSELFIFILIGAFGWCIFLIAKRKK